MTEALDLSLDVVPLENLGNHLRTRTLIHAEMVRRVIAEADEAPIELAEVLEDIANTYLDVAEEISALALLRRRLER